MIRVPWAVRAGFDICGTARDCTAVNTWEVGGKARAQERKRHVYISCLGVYSPSLELYSDKQQNEVRHIREWGRKQQPNLGAFQTLRIQATVRFTIIIAEPGACCPGNRAWKSEDQFWVFPQAQRADLRKSSCLLMSQPHICRAGTRAAAPQKRRTKMKKTYSITWLTSQNFS